MMYAMKTKGESKKQPGAMLAMAAVIVPLMLVIFGWRLLSKADDAAAKNSECGSATMAFVMSQKFVLRELKAPASAKFPSSAVVTPIGGCAYSVAAWVDSQNGFGAIVRSDYHVIMESSADGRSWSARSLAIQ